MDDLLNAAKKAAYRAGEEILKIYQTEFTVERKGDGSPVTEADIAAHRIIAEELKPLGIPVLSEEAADDTDRMSSSRVWIIDPIDGTSGFVDKGGDFVVMIGLVQDHKPVLGVVYRPVKGIMYFAEKDRGAYKVVTDGVMERVHVSKRSTWEDMRIATSKHHLSERIRGIIDTLNIGGVVRVSSVGIKAAYIAESRADVYFTETSQMGEWDICAPQIILEEAGGMMTGILGEALEYNKLDVKNPHGVLATNGVYHNEMIEYFKSQMDQREEFSV